MARQEPRPLRRGWTTGACPAAAVWAAYAAVLTGEFPDPVTHLPRGQKPAFPLTPAGLGTRHTHAGIAQDAGDDPDVTYSATIIADLAWAEPGFGVTFTAGEGVGMAAARDRDSLGAVADAAGPRGLADGVARRLREVALAVLSGGITVEVAIVGDSGEFLAGVGAGAPP